MLFSMKTILALAALAQFATAWEIMAFEDTAGSSFSNPCSGGGTTVPGSGSESCVQLPQNIVTGMELLSTDGCTCKIISLVSISRY